MSDAMILPSVDHVLSDFAGALIECDLVPWSPTRTISSNWESGRS